ncbi:MULTISPECIES: dolichyl-phosphate beta-glucosyltransferase [Herpetosiphon]|uniref:dolichyl-phosphate beta-glucosyltransferase n=1 Tax=Herpetosiphon TaxID=64 RepID=UPI000D7C6CC9|nr:dolichyl-phosphate beta-glucosyltransferase [Herpetosiphon llansteffanensis]
MAHTDYSVDIVIPVLNEEQQLEQSVLALRDFLQASCPYRWRIVVADNGSTDRTPQICHDLRSRFPGEVDFERLEQRGRGRALRTAWLKSNADVLCYMDVDLSTNLRALPPLLAALIHSDYSLGTGSRLMHGAIVTRQWKREMISRAYNFLIRLLFWHRFRDAQCGFKAITRQAAQELIPTVRDNEWFFDTELLLKAEKRGYRIFEVPVEWIEDLGTTVKIVKTAWQDIKGLVRVRLGG